MAIATGTALLGAAALGTAGSIYSANQAKKGAKQAANIQSAAGREAIDVLRGDLEPFRQQGAEALGLLTQNLLSPQTVTAESVVNDPFFSELARSQEESTLRQRAALGLAGSGGTQDILQRNLLQLGEGFRQNRFNEQQARFNQLFNIANLGQASAAQTGAQSANILTDIGSAQSAVPLAAAQGRGQVASSIANLGGAFLGSQIKPTTPFTPLGAGTPVSGVGTGFFGSGEIPSSLTNFMRP